MNKEIFSTKNFIQEEIYRMDSFGADDSMCLAYHGDPEDAPVSALYVYKEVKAIYKVHTADRVTIKDGLNMTLDSFSLLGWSYVTKGNPTPEDGGIMKVSRTDNIYKVSDGTNEIIIYTYQPLCALSETLRDYYQDGYIYYNTAYHKLTSDLVWLVDYVNSTNDLLVVKLYLPDGGPNQNDMLCTHFTPSSSLSKSGDMMIKDSMLYLAISRNTTEDIIAFKEWLDENLVYIVYERKAVNKVLSAPCVLATHDGDTVISNNAQLEMLIAYRVLPNMRIWERQEDGTFKELQRED